MSLHIIGGKHKGKRLSTPAQTSTRPTQSMLREAVFNICQCTIEAALFLDLYAGSGAIGLEALSRGAKHVTFVEKKRDAIVCIKKNIEELQVASQATLLTQDALSALSKLTTPFDIIYIDPPYDLNTKPILQYIAEHDLLHVGGLLFLEERHDPRKPAAPFIPQHFQLKSSRRFGIALLHQYLRLA